MQETLRATSNKLELNLELKLKTGRLKLEGEKEIPTLRGGLALLRGSDYSFLTEAG